MNNYIITTITAITIITSALHQHLHPHYSLYCNRKLVIKRPNWSGPLCRLYPSNEASAFSPCSTLSRLETLVTAGNIRSFIQYSECVYECMYVVYECEYECVWVCVCIRYVYMYTYKRTIVHLWVSLCAQDVEVFPTGKSLVFTAGRGA